MSAKPTADVSVRVAWGDDAPGIAAVQVRAWRAAYADLLPADALDGPGRRADGRRLAGVAGAAQGRPQPGPGGAGAQPDLSASRSPAPPPTPTATRSPTARSREFSVDPDEQRKGHGSRLVQACADTLVADRFTRAVTWLTSTDDVLREFLTGAGWAPDGAHRELDLARRRAPCWSSRCGCTRRWPEACRNH